jgi:hypothetical protein
MSAVLVESRVAGLREDLINTSSDHDIAAQE